ncbi:hemerythrin [Ruminiclostridium sufflavum DSM 19573]|uniref:Hemerythrin n=1 Tax=Ruminiclostridium sufflavum DSM 19573 TaxID=1121337 RepID=A0A318XNZ1_9FIRM|nr:hemerythrin family protein [Ruminiclostridium sufflavum]PYG89875.1 hemerythrin [Ruminiclostridium sufflavum DSM 19573]
MYEMKPEYYTGIASIDEEHTKLFAIANECYDLLTNQFIEDKYDYILNVIKDLKEYTKYHFKNEEEYMSSIGYKKLLSQKVAHNDFIEKINSINYNTIDANQKDSLLELLDFLTTWLVEHILKQDTLIGK